MFRNRNLSVRGPELKLDTIIAGITKLISTKTTLVVDGKSITQPELLKELSALQATYKAKRNAWNELDKALEAVVSNEPAVKQAIDALKVTIPGLIGTSNPDLKEFGMKPKGKRTPLTSEEKVLKAERARRTREERGTLGSRQKASIQADPVNEVSVSRDANTETTGTAPSSGAPATPSTPPTPKKGEVA